MMIRKVDLQFLQNMKAITGVVPHALVVADTTKIRKIVRTHIKRGKISLLRDDVRKQFEEKVIDLVGWLMFQICQDDLKMGLYRHAVRYDGWVAEAK